MTSEGFARPSFTSSQSRISAVGALPIANIASGVFSAAISMLTTARVTPRASAASRTSFSAMRQTTSTPKRAAEVLFIPAAAMFVSVTTAQPAASARRARSTAPSEKRRFFTKSKSAVVWTTRLTIGRFSAGPSHGPISAPIILMLSCSISSGLIMNTSRPSHFYIASAMSGSAAAASVIRAKNDVVAKFQKSSSFAVSLEKSPK